MRGKPAEAPWRLALLIILQFIEGLSDVEVVAALQERISWKYLFGLAIDEPLFDPSVLTKFRTRLVENKAEERLFDLLLCRLSDKGYLRARGRQRTDSTAVLSKVRALNRLTLVGETMRATLNALASVHPYWLKEVVPQDWHKLYDLRFEDYHLPKNKEEREELARTIGRHGFILLAEIQELKESELFWLNKIPAVEILRQIWTQQYYPPDADKQTKWRTNEEAPPPAELISSPYELDSRYATKGNVSWIGYKVHLTETCDDDLPHLLVDVKTTRATVVDAEMIEPIEQTLLEKGIPPAEHYADAGYINAGNIVFAKEGQIDLIGPVGGQGWSWQTRVEGGVAASEFKIDWEEKKATCPGGKVSVKWVEQKSAYAKDHIQVHFKRGDCAVCPLHALCTKAKTAGRELHLLPKKEYEALKRVRQRQNEEEFKEKYTIRAGIEGTLSETTRHYELRKSRYRGLDKTRLQHQATAAGLNLIRLDAWLCKRQRSTTRQSPFAALENCA